MVQPSSIRERFSSIPSTKWEDIGGLKSLQKEFERYIVERIKNPEGYEMNEAAMAALEGKQTSMNNGSSYTRRLVIQTSHFEKALGKITSSVSAKQRHYYEALSENYVTRRQLDSNQVSNVNYMSL